MRPVLQPRNRTMFRLSMLCLIAFNVFLYSSRWLDPSWVDTTDGLAGIALGASIGLLWVSTRKPSTHAGTHSAT